MVAARVCVVGSLNADLVARVPRRPATGETVTGTGFATGLGGKGFNQAVAAARCGATVAMVGRVGNDGYADQLLSALTAEGIDRTHVRTDPVTGTGVAVVLVEDGGDNTIVVVPQANALLGADLVRAAAVTISTASVLLLQCEVPEAAVLAAAETARAAGTTVVLNTAPAQLPVQAFRGLVDHVVANETEAAVLTGLSPDGGIALLAERLRRDAGARSAVITLGARGALVDDGAQTLVRAHAVTSVDTVGAGDAFCGALGSALARGVSLLEAVRFGSAAGALAVGSVGASSAMPTRAAVEQLLQAGGPDDEEAPRQRREAPSSGAS